jgi:hypothetical protein
MSNTIIRAPRRNRFAIIDNRILEDERISWAAKGLLCFLLSLPDNWKVRVSHLVKIGNLKRDGIYKLLRELRDVGHVVYMPLRDDQGCFRGGAYVVHEIPNSPHTNLPDTVPPDTASPDPVKPEALPNTDIYKKRITTTTEGNSSGGEISVSDLVFPHDLLPAEQTQAEQMIQVLIDPSIAQQVLDEWDGIIKAGAIRSSKIGCLRGLARKAQEGSFTPERGLRIAQARRNKRRFEAAQEKIKVQQPQELAPIDESNPLVQRIAAFSKHSKKQ